MKAKEEKREIQITHGEFAEAWSLCQWCDSLFPESELQEERDLGNLCEQCISAISSRGEEVWLLRGGHWTYLRICRSGIKEFYESRQRTRRLSSHSLPLVAPIRLSMPPAGFRGDCIIATRAVSGQLTAFFISESVELCPLYFSADFRIIFTICTCIGFFPCCWEKLHFSSNLDLQFFHIANVVKIKFYSFFFSFFPAASFV